MKKMILFISMIFIITSSIFCAGPATTEDLFFSEYIEGGSNNKALEIYNGTGAEVDLSNYIMKGNYNGNAWSEVYTFPAGATIADEDVYVIANNQADAAILAVADTVYAYAAPYYIVAFNGDDVRGLFKISGTDTTMIDIIGAYDMVDPGSGWDVAGVSASTQDHTLIRKATVTSGNSDWTASAGTNADDSEWIVLDKDTFTDLGSHTVTDDAPLLTEDLFFSEYIEGSSSNRAIEIFNGTGADVDLSAYTVKQSHNGTGWGVDGIAYVLPLTGTLSDGDVFVIANEAADAAALAVADLIFAYSDEQGAKIPFFTGNDAMGLFKADVLIDVIGTPDTDPGSGWDVAGVSEATEDHTLIRKSFVTSGFTDWDVMAGTSTANSEWTVLAKDTLTDLGSHTVTDDAPTTADVTFNVNTSTVRIITDSLSTVDLRGTATQWGPGTDLTCVGGDYWEITIPLAASTGFEYKYGARTTNIDGTESEWWENDIPGADYQGLNRTFSTRYFDQVIDLDYLGHGPDNNTPNYTPSDSIDVFFRVNMGNDLDFNPDNILSIVGAIPANGADNIWSPGTYALTQEGTSDYWNIHLKLDPDSAAFDSMMYRFHNNGIEWDGHSENVIGHGMFPDGENRGISIGYNDTTIAWVWWNDDAPQPFTSNDSTNITFNADMSKASNNNSYTVGDTLLVKVGYGNSSTEVVTDTLTRMGFTFSYSTTIAKLPVIYDKQLFYQYYLYKRGQEQREVFFNFDYEGNDVSMNERRFIVVSGTTTLVNDTEDSKVSGRRMPIFRNNDIIAQTSLTLTLECDIRPAIYQVLSGSTLNDIQSNATITPAMMTANPDTILNLGVFVNGPLSNNAESTWQGWGGTLANDTTRQMYDDGTHGDQWVGDSIFTIVYTLSSDSGHTVGQEFKYGIGGGDNETGYGLNHIENLDDSGTETTLYTQFGSINPNFYDAWDYDNPNPRVDKVENEIPTEFALKQNYPNPFNPSTTIEFAIPKLADVNLTIYNVLGQSIKNIQMNNTQAGRYSIIWNGTNNFGAKVSTGIYFYKIKAGKYSDIKKMVFMK